MTSIEGTRGIIVGVLMDTMGTHILDVKISMSVKILISIIAFIIVLIRTEATTVHASGGSVETVERTGVVAIIQDGQSSPALAWALQHPLR